VSRGNPTSVQVTLTIPDEGAYRAMHAELYARYPGQYVAVYQGQLVDHDPDGEALFERIDQRFPDEIVLMTQVRETPEY
jgi:hypothetical protein